MQSFLQYRRRQQSSGHQKTGGRSDSPPSALTYGTLGNIEIAPGTRNHEDDPRSPREWSWRYKVFCTVIIFNLTFVAGWASAAGSSALKKASYGFHVSEETESLTTAMYLFAVGIGALFTGSLSEMVGRNPTYLVGGFCFLLFLMGCGLVQNFTSQVVLRAFTGLFASPSMTIFGGSLADMFDTDARALVWPAFSLAPLLGPLIAPIPSGWIAQSALSWRWIDWVTLIISGFAFALAFLFLPETRYQAIPDKTQSNSSGQDDAPGPEGHKEELGIVSTFVENWRHMVLFLTMEPITISIGIYMTFLYVLIFTFLHGFDFIFTRTYQWTPGQTGSAFSAICIGVILGVPYVMLANRFWGTHTAQKPRRPSNADQSKSCVSTSDDDTGPEPELRLIPTIPTTPLLPLTLFWLGFTNHPSIPYWSSLAACSLLGFTLTAFFTPAYHYVIDSYSVNSSSAMAAITFMRYWASGAMVIATIPMYRALTVRWTMTLLGCVAILLIPVPWVFWRYGKRIRAKSRFAREAQGL